MTSWSEVPEAIRSKFPQPPDKSSFDSREEYEEAMGFWQGHVGRLVMMALRRHKETPRLLFFRVVPHNRGLVFADPERADHIAAIHLAIRTSCSWGEFKARMPSEELERLLSSLFDDAGEARPADSDAFTGDALPGWSEGDYPPWLQQEQKNVLPDQVLQAFGQLTSTPVNGSYWHIPEEHAASICAALQDLGFNLELRQDQPFH